MAREFSRSIALSLSHTHTHTPVYSTGRGRRGERKHEEDLIIGIETLEKTKAVLVLEVSLIQLNVF